MHFLFMKSSLDFPRRSGHDVHCYSMMRELGAMGHSISLMTDVPVSAEAIAGVNCLHCQTFAEYSKPATPVRLSNMQERFRAYWGVPEQDIAILADAAKSWKADVVVVVGLNVLPYLAGIRSATRVWYAADEWVLHHLSQVFPSKPASWSELKTALVKGVYERVYASSVERVWVVSQRDARAVRWVMGSKVDVAPNGVDLDHYCRRSVNAAEPRSCVFWGRLDFGPNVDAVQWFCTNVWRPLKREMPDAVFRVYGFAPTDKIRDLAHKYDFDMIPDLPDIRSEIIKHQAVVLPFVSGAGIKNKLLEAASLSMPIVASPRVVGGLCLNDHQPLMVADRPARWIASLTQLWEDQKLRDRYGRGARQWVVSKYSWRQAAEKVLRPLAAGEAL